jgi:hypothetical protein
MKMRSLLLTVLVGLPLLLAGIALVSYFFRNPLIEGAIETGGGYATGVETSVESVDFKPGDGALTISGFALANPDGFEQPTFLSLKTAETKVRVMSLLSDTAEVDHIMLDGLSVELSRHDGAFNYQRILDQVAKFELDESESEGKYKVDVISITNVSALIALVPGGGELTRGGVTIEEITLTNLGTQTQSLAGLTATIVQGVLKAITQAGTSGLPDQLVAGLRTALNKSDRAAAMQVSVKGVKTTGALDKIRSLTDDLLEGKIDLKEDLKDLGQGLLGGDKK